MTYLKIVLFIWFFLCEFGFGVCESIAQEMTVDKQRIAVLELINNADLQDRVLASLTETARGVVAQALGSKYIVITRENIFALVDAQTCDDVITKSCEVEIGRMLGAHFIVSGSVTKIGRSLKVALKAHSTSDFRLMGVCEGDVKNVDSLGKEVKKVAADIVSLIDPSRAVLLHQNKDKMKDELKKRRLHEKEVFIKFEEIMKIAENNPVEAEVALKLFIREYKNHKLGNPKILEAETLLHKIRAQKDIKDRAHLDALHLAAVIKSWERYLPLVSRGDEKAEVALELFLKEYENHALGNPLALEARQVFESAHARYHALLLENHKKLLNDEWGALFSVVKSGGKPALEAVESFLKKYKDHPLGNPLEDEVRRHLEILKIRGSHVLLDSKNGIDWVLIPSGYFNMGSVNGDESPIRTVYLRAFLMSRTEVTVGQYRRCVIANICSKPGTHSSNCTWTHQPSDKENYPVNCVNWGQARTFAKWVGADLPTEAEWEYAALGGEQFKYSGSNHLDNVAWYQSNSGGAPRAVGLKRANKYNLYDMSGNVWEWVLDEYKNNYNGASSDGHQIIGRVSRCKKICENKLVKRVFRGGGWTGRSDDLRISNRFYYLSNGRSDYVGIRLRKSI